LEFPLFPTESDALAPSIWHSQRVPTNDPPSSPPGGPFGCFPAFKPHVKFFRVPFLPPPKQTPILWLYPSLVFSRFVTVYYCPPPPRKSFQTLTSFMDSLQTYPPVFPFIPNSPKTPTCLVIFRKAKNVCPS